MSNPGNQTVSSNAINDGKGDGDSTGELRHEIAQTRQAMSSTLSAIETKLSPQHLAAQAKDSLAASAQARANQLALTLRDRVGPPAEQLRRRYDELNAQYPWFPAALLASALMASALVLWRLNARRG